MVVVVAEVVPRPQQLREAAVREAVVVEEEPWELVAVGVAAVERHHRVSQLESQRLLDSSRHQHSRRRQPSRRRLSSRRYHHRHHLLRLLLR